MEIGAIPGIGAVQPVRAERTAKDLAGVFRVEFQREQQDSYSPHREGADRGLEEEQDEAAETSGIRAAADSGDGADRVSFFA
ncbi:MAG: hypothetical protein ACLGSD_10675 [Acidobacteriota bacterium]